MNIFADLYECQAIDVLEEWNETFHVPLFETEEPNLLTKHGLDEDNLRIVVDKLDPGDLAMVVDEPDTHCNFRPTEYLALDADKDYDIDKAIRKNARDKAIVMRSAFVKRLDQEHRKFVESVKKILLTITTIDDLYALVDVCIEHDNKLKKLTGRDFCGKDGTFGAIVYDFFNAEDRIRASKTVTVKPTTVIVHTEQIAYPILMVKEKGKAWAYTPNMVKMLEARGYAPQDS